MSTFVINSENKPIWILTASILMNNLLSVSFLARDIHLFVYPFVFLTVIAFIFLIFNYPVRAVFLGLTLFFFYFDYIKLPNP